MPDVRQHSEAKDTLLHKFYTFKYVRKQVDKESFEKFLLPNFIMHKLCCVCVAKKCRTSATLSD